MSSWRNQKIDQAPNSGSSHWETNPFDGDLRWDGAAFPTAECWLTIEYKRKWLDGCQWPDCFTSCEHQLIAIFLCISRARHVWSKKPAVLYNFAGNHYHVKCFGVLLGPRCFACRIELGSVHLQPLFGCNKYISRISLPVSRFLCGGDVALFEVHV